MPNAISVRIRITRVVKPGEIGRQIEPHMRALGDAMAVRAQRLVPKRTWALHDTITVDTDRSGDRVTTTVAAGSADVDYALYVERGTSRMAAQPYLRPALAQTKSADLDHKGKGPTVHGIIGGSTRRSRRRS